MEANHLQYMRVYLKVSRLEFIMKYMLTTVNTQEAIQRVMAVELTRLTHKIVIQLHLVGESCTSCSSHSGSTPSYGLCFIFFNILVKAYTLNNVHIYTIIAEEYIHLKNMQIAVIVFVGVGIVFSFTGVPSHSGWLMVEFRQSSAKPMLPQEDPMRRPALIKN